MASLSNIPCGYCAREAVFVTVSRGGTMALYRCPESHVTEINQTRATRPRARNTDPATSHEAAASVTGLRDSQESILKMFRRYGPMTDEQLVNVYEEAGAMPRQSRSGIRTRRSELVDKRRLVDTGARRVLRSGRKAIVWGLK